MIHAGRKASLAAGACAMLLVMAGALAYAQGTAVFQLHGSTPIVSHGVSGTWDDRYTDPGAVLFHDGKYHMFRNGFRGWPASVEWGYVTSPDGLTWTKQGADPVFRSAQVPYAGVAALASSALVQDDGTWVVYFYTFGGGGADTSGNWSIGRATAPGPTGPWTPDAAPVLKPGPAGAWDETLESPSVVKTADGYRMYYSGSVIAGLSRTRIGMATSTDGVRWTKYNDPATGDRFAESDPVFGPSGDPNAWDRVFVQQPHVVQSPQGWIMLYRSSLQQAPTSALGYAMSSDGIKWERAAANPVLRPTVVSGGNGIFFSNLLYHADTYLAFLEVGTGMYTDIYVATHKGALPIEVAKEGVGVTPTQGSATSTPSQSPTTTTAQPPPVALPGSNSRTFAETGKSVRGLFLDYWEQHGGLAQQGFPISEVIGEVSDLDGKPYTVQYFERAVFEYHPENQPPHNVLLSQLGTFQYRKKYPDGAPNQQANNSAGSVLFNETGKRLGGKFLTYWQEHGGLAQQGFPISDEFTEVSPLDGKPYTVQYFERAVFELHPENAGTPYEVLLSQLGTFQYKAKYGDK